jgi:metal-responsive CopG/Arc/MetJ family transcriptional regulator
MNGKPTRNVQFSLDEDLIETVDKLAAAANLSRSAVVRDALRKWVREREVKKLEDEWIAKLREEPQDSSDAAAWADAESWSDE